LETFFKYEYASRSFYTTFKAVKDIVLNVDKNFVGKELKPNQIPQKEHNTIS